MTDTIRTDIYLTGTTFAGGTNSIGPQAERDLTVSKVNVLDVFDDSANALGLGKPAIILGTTYLSKCAGVTVGSGQTLTVRQNNATAVNNALSVASTNNKYLAWDGIFEINNSAGVTVPAMGTGGPGLKIRGEMQNSALIQFYNSASGAPTLTLGDTSVTGTPLNYLDIDGLNVRQGGSPIGLTASVNVVLANMGGCTIRNLVLGLPADQANSPYNQVVSKCAMSGAAVFSCLFENWLIHGTQNDMIQLNLTGSGNKWGGNLYMSNGPSGVYNAMSGSFINWQSNDESLFDVVNCEWAACRYMFNFPQGTFNKLHVEGLQMTGASPCLFFTSADAWRIAALQVTNPVIQSANFTGSASLIQDFNGSSSNICIDQFYLYYYTVGLVTAALRLYGYGGSAAADSHGTVTINHGVIDDQTFTGALQPLLFFDDHMPVSSFVMPQRWESYSYGVAGSRVSRALIPISATYTHYGQHEDATLLIPAVITSFTATLGAVKGATGTQAVRTGSTVHVRRIGSSPSGTFTLQDDASTTLATNTTTGTVGDYQFTGSHYVSYTPVT